jgi:peptide chain release factor 3
MQRFGNDLSDALQAIDLIRGASPAFDHEEFLAGKQTPVFFGSAINNFGVREILDALVDLAPPPESRNAIQREVFPDEQKFSGMVFKIQANMNLAHRDRIAFVRICSGSFQARHELKSRA